MNGPFNGNAAVDLRKFSAPVTEEADQYELATPNQRVVAFLIDGFMTGVLGKATVAIAMALTHATKPGLGGSIMTILVQAYYWIFLEYNNGQTLGKKIMKIRVVSTDGNADLTLGQVCKREMFGRFISGATLGWGYIGAWKRQDRATFHDRYAKTAVVKVTEA